MPIYSIINLREFIPVIEKQHSFSESWESPRPLEVSGRDVLVPDSSFLAAAIQDLK